jgi:segregation and condensation protein B
MADEKNAQKSESPLSLSRLREAFAAMLGESKTTSEPEQAVDKHPNPSGQSPPSSALPCEINPRSVVEAILFVGHPDNSAFTARELAVAMRGVSPAEIEEAVTQLNAAYEADDAPYVIEGTRTGYRLVLRHDFGRLRDKFYGTVREAKLSPAALEVLSIVAYNQPITTEQINSLRNAPNSGAIATLVRRGLLRLDRPTDADAPPQYSTTDRFLRLFNLETLDALPRSEEVENAAIAQRHGA